MATKEDIKRKLEEDGFSTSPGLLAETIYAYVLDERERCIKILADATKDEEPCGNTWSTLVACQTLINQG